MRLICDAHLDLAMNAVSFDRDPTLSLDRLNHLERHMTDHPARGRAVVSFPEMRAGGVGVCLATVLAREHQGDRPTAGYRRIDFDHGTPDAAASTAMGQLAWYRLLARRGELRLIEDAGALDQHVAVWRARLSSSPEEPPIGIILSMEGADPILDPSDCERWWMEGLRVASLVHYGHNRYAAGTGVSGPITDAGRALLDEFSRLGIILDLTHLSDRAFFEAIDRFDGPVLASHNNCRALVPGDRQYSDEQIHLIAERGGVVCVALDAWMLYPGWVKGRTNPEVLSLKDVADQIEHIIETTGSIDHVGIGSDLDGGFGNEQTPGDCRSIAALQGLGSHLLDRGLSNQEVDAVLHGNLVRFLERHLPAGDRGRSGV